MSKTSVTRPPEYLREARLNAGYVNRCTAITRIPFSPETIGRHERGEVALEPEDLLQYVEGYNCPELCYLYCADCPVGKHMGRTATILPFPFAALRVSKMLTDAPPVVQSLTAIAFYGEVQTRHRAEFERNIAFLSELERTVTDMLLFGMKNAAPAGTGNGA